MVSTWHSPYILVYTDSLLTFPLVSMPSIYYPPKKLPALLRDYKMTVVVNSKKKPSKKAGHFLGRKNLAFKRGLDIPEITSSHLQISLPNRKIVFQPSISGLWFQPS